MAEKEYIERKDLINNRPPQRNPDQTGKEEYNKGYNDGIKAVLSCIEIQPSADVTPVRHGHWVSEYDCGYITPHCSECGETALTKEETSYDYVYSSYCPRCGAKMDKTE